MSAELYQVCLLHMISIILVGLELLVHIVRLEMAPIEALNKNKISEIVRPIPAKVYIICLSFAAVPLSSIMLGISQPNSYRVPGFLLAQIFFLIILTFTSGLIIDWGFKVKGFHNVKGNWIIIGEFIFVGLALSISPYVTATSF
jgi:hypothetical protein